VTEAEVRAGLEDYETVFESLRSVVGRRRRRRRSTARRPGGESEGSAAGSSVGHRDEQAPNQAEDDPGSDEHQ